MRTRASLFFATMAALVGLVGCNIAQPAVNRVQPDVVEKGTFDGEWYYLQTVIDTPYSASYTFVGEQGPMEKIVWEIQEDFLIARRAYEHIAGSEPVGLAEDTLHGAAIAMYKIKKHFDIRREYNTVTGEELNVIVENSSDRPWYDREYMRIDWSENLITNSEFLVMARLFDGIEAEPVAYSVQQGTDHPHEPQFVVDPNDPEQVHYIDIVNKLFVRPTTVYIEGFGDIPSCYLMGSSHLDCAPGEITVRNSFLKVDASRDYQPFNYTGDRMERFGYFVTERAGYDERYGVVEPARFRFANRHNIWMQSHQMGADGSPIRCTEANATMTCGGRGATCDLDWARVRRERDASGEWLGACTLPYRDREVRPIAYHVSSNFPEDLIADAQRVADGWNDTFVETVASLRENECLADSGDAASCAAERGRADGSRVFLLCHNPVLETDDPSCGQPGDSAQIGDLRYHLFGWVSEPHAMSPLGYGPSANDPETGELIQANAFVYGAGVETLSAFARDMISLLNGDIDSADISSSEVVRSWVERQRAPGSRETGRPADDHHTSIDGFSVDRVDAAMDFSRANAISAAAGGSAGAPASIPEALARFEQSRDRLRRGGAFGQGEELGSARLQNLVGTDIEQMMSGPEMQLMAGLDPFMPLDARSVAAASPFQGMSVSRMAALERARARIAQESHCLLRADFADDGLLGLAREIQRAVSSGDGTLDWYGQTYTLRAPDGSIDQEAVRLMIRHPIFDGVTAHETGHTVGLRHNFSGSYDSLNYHARYWELRDDGSMQPRAWDPLTDAEIDGRIREYQYSTVMDYGNNFVVTDAAGLGHYDYAAIKMGYGDMVEVFSNAADPSTINWIHFITKLGWPVPFRLEAFTGGAPAAYQYTEMPGILGGRERLEERADVPYTSLRADPFLAGGGIFDELQDANGRPSVPYLFCSDEQADLGPDCLRYDAGADPYETITSVADQYWNYYIFNAFRRGRLGFDPWSYANRVHSRYMSKLQYTNQIYALYRPIFDDMFGGTPGFDTFFTRPDGMGAYTAAVGVGFETFTQVITTPEPGEYVTMTRPDGSTGMTQGGDFGVTPDASIDAFEGRGLETTWDFDAGYYWFDQLDRAGYYYDKVLAIMVLTDPETHFLGRDTAADVRRYQISYYSSFPGAMESLFGGLLGEDWDAVAPRVDGTGLVYPDPLDLVSGGMPGVPVDPNASFSIQLFASVYGMALIPETFDRTYMNKSRIWVRGGAEGVEIDPRWPIVEFMDVTSGLTYVAASYLDAAGVETGPGARMLNYAQALSDAGASAELARYLDNINLVRRLSWLFELGF